MDTTPAASAAAWDAEYREGGIPSSHRDEPSGVVRWTLANLPFLGLKSGRALDVGCGKGRNTREVARAGFETTGIDYSNEAISIAKSLGGEASLSFLLRDMNEPLPFEDSTIDLVLDIFVYFHNLSGASRRRYREEIHRVLRPTGVVVLSLATAGDGYYAACPALEPNERPGDIPLKWDPEARVGNILPTQEQFLAELEDLFRLEMTWLKRKPGPMHGRTFIRETYAAILRPKG